MRIGVLVLLLLVRDWRRCVYEVRRRGVCVLDGVHRELVLLMGRR